MSAAGRSVGGRAPDDAGGCRASASLRRRSARALASVLPDPRETLLLRASLDPGPDGLRYWAAWRDGAGSPRDELGRDEGTRVVLALLHDALRRRRTPLEPALRTYLRAAYATETLRYRRYRAICGHALSALRAAGIESIVLKGGALAETVYADPVLRHTDDLDLLVREADLPHARDVLIRAGFRSTTSAPDTGRHHHLAPLVHSSGLPGS